MKEKKKMHIVDLIFVVGIVAIAILGACIDIFWSNVNFPVYSCVSIYGSYALWFILLLYSFFKYRGKEKADKPRYVRWFTCFILPYAHCVFVAVGLIGANILRSLFSAHG